MKAPLGEMPSTLGTCAGRHKPQTGWCHLERALTPSGICPASCFALSKRVGKGAVLGGRAGKDESGAGLLRLSPYPATDTSPRTHHVTPLPGPWVLCTAFGKKLSLFIDYTRNISRLKLSATNIPQQETPSNLFLPCVAQLPGKQEPFPSPHLFLAQVTNSPGQSLSPPTWPCSTWLHGGLGPAGAVQESACDMQWKKRQIQCNTQTQVWSPLKYGQSWDFYLLPDTGPAGGRDGGMRQIFHLHFNFNKIVLFCVLLLCWLQ